MKVEEKNSKKPLQKIFIKTNLVDMRGIRKITGSTIQTTKEMNSGDDKPDQNNRIEQTKLNTEKRHNQDTEPTSNMPMCAI